MNTEERNSRVTAVLQESRELERSLRVLKFDSAADTITAMREIILDDEAFASWSRYHANRDEYEAAAEARRGAKAVE